MKLVQIFQAVEETRFLRELSSYDRLFFIGDSTSLNYLKNFFDNLQPTESNYYYDTTANQLSNLTEDILQLNNYQAIVIVSLADENLLNKQVEQKLENFIHPPILSLFSDIFINLLCKKWLLQPASNQEKPARKSYAIATTPRSGSTYLCNLLESTKIAGYPSEHLRFAAQELSRHCNFNYLKLLNNVKSDRVTDNGVFGTKLISHFLFELEKTKPDFRQIFQSIDKFILLIRKDKLAQAVSLVIAQKTEVWHLSDNAKNNNYESKLSSIKIDDALFDNVAQKYDFICQQEAALKKTFANHQIEPLTVVYEDILEDAELQIDRILDFLKIAKPESNFIQIESRIKRMPSSFSQEIIKQYQKKGVAL